MFGDELNFFHGVFVAAICAVVANVVVSKLTQVDIEKSKLTFVGLNIFTESSLRSLVLKILISLVIYAILGFTMWKEILSPTFAAILGSLWTWGMFISTSLRENSQIEGSSLIKDDRIWGGLLAACAVFMLFYFK